MCPLALIGEIAGQSLNGVKFENLIVLMSDSQEIEVNCSEIIWMARCPIQAALRRTLMFFSRPWRNYWGLSAFWLYYYALND